MAKSDHSRLQGRAPFVERALATFRARLRTGPTNRLMIAQAEPVFFAVFAGACTLWVALLFYGSMHQQLSMLYASVENEPLAGELRRLGPWSAPLDDVFIHFDLARATARGYPFEWSEGNGYSTGGTSLLYPFVLAAGYWLGFRQLSLMLWAAMLACVSVWTVTLASRRLFRDLPTWTSYLAPPALLSVGVLDWTLFSGMEVALFLAIWAGALCAWDELVRTGEASPWWRAAALGGWCAALTATRPEGATTVAVLALAAGAVQVRARGWGAAVLVTALSALPAAAVMIGQSLTNWVLTGDSAAAGAIAKLEIYDPFRSPAQVVADWRFHVTYQIERITQYHLSERRHGWLVWSLALVALIPAATRRYALLLWSSAILWVATVGLNGQVRWQNERYAMPALAWLLLAASLGLADLLCLPQARRGQPGHRLGDRRGRGLRLLASGGALAAVVAFCVQQRPRFREQLWFFGRASRNILEQHVQAGLTLRHRLLPPPRRVALGDAGAIPYASDTPALDLIGLGGFRGLPFARAKRLGLPAVLELLEALPPGERPDLLALYPSWWDVLPAWFGEPIMGVPVRGNVICGGQEKVLYRPRWEAFSESQYPHGLQPGERIVDAVDPADIRSEKAHDYRLVPADQGHLTMKLLPSPRGPAADLWDGGRIVGANTSEFFWLRGFQPGRPARIVLRVAPSQPALVNLWVNGQSQTLVTLKVKDGWDQVSIPLAPASVGPDLELQLQTLKGERISYHVWGIQGS